MGHKRSKFMTLDSDILEDFEALVPKGKWTKTVEELLAAYVKKHK